MKQEKPGMSNKAKPAQRQGSGLTRPGELYVPGDALPQPEVVEKNTDSVWALWSDMVEEEGEGESQTDATRPPVQRADDGPDNDFSETVPMDLDGMEPTQLMDLPDLPDDDDNK